MAQYRIDNINYIESAGDERMLINLDTVSVDNLCVDTGNIHKNWTFVFDKNKDPRYEIFSNIYNSHRLKRYETKSDLSVQHKNNRYALFDFKDLAIRSEIDNTTISSEYNFMYGPKLEKDPIGFTQSVGNGKTSIYGLTEPTTESLNIVHTDLLDTRDTRIKGNSSSIKWKRKLQSIDNPTYTYIPVSDLELKHDADDDLSLYSNVSSYYQYIESYGALSSQILSTLFIPKYNYLDIEKNYIYQINDADTNKMTYIPDFNAGNFHGNTLIGKNMLDAKYCTNLESLEHINNTRAYCGIGSVGGKIFLKYYDETSYNTKHTPEKTSLSSNIQEIETTQTKPVTNSYQNVEIIDSINRFTNRGNHKSNMYSIRLNLPELDSRVDNNPVLKDNLDKIKSDIQKSVRMIAEHLEPAHTQLFNVEILGQ